MWPFDPPSGAGATSPFTGTSGVRETVLPGVPSDSVVFAGNGGNPNASSFISGFLEPGNDTGSTRATGLLPSLFMNYTGGTTNLGDVDVSLSPAEQEMVARFPNQFRKFGEMADKYGIAFYLGVFLFVFFVFGVLWKKVRI